MNIVLLIPGYIAIVWVLWIVVASTCKMFWRFYYSGGPVLGVVGAVVGWLFAAFVPIHEYWITGVRFEPTVKKKIVFFHKEMHLWVQATFNPSRREEILGYKLLAPQMQRMTRFLDDD